MFVRLIKEIHLLFVDDEHFFLRFNVLGSLLCWEEAKFQICFNRLECGPHT